MDLVDAQNYFSNLSNTIRDAHVKAALAASSAGLDLIKERVITKGENSRGELFNDYSDTDLPTFFIKSRTGSDRLRKKVEKKQSKASYKDIREAAGLQTEHRDFRFTGRMWNNIRPSILKNENGKLVININAESELEKKKVEWNINQSGNFLKPNKSEILKIKEYYIDHFINLVVQ